MQWIAQNKLVLDATNKIVAMADNHVIAQQIVDDHNMGNSILFCISNFPDTGGEVRILKALENLVERSLANYKILLQQEDSRCKNE